MIALTPRLAFALVACAGFAPAAQEPGVAPAAAPLDRGAVATEVEAIRSEFEVPALAGVLIDRDGQIVLAGVAGTTTVGGDVPVTLDARWHLGSCLKAMTATVAATYVAEGRLAWDSSPLDVLGDSFEQVDPAWRDVTLEQLLSHRAGAASATDDRAFWLGLIGDRGAPRAARGRLVEWVLARPTAFDPGSAYAYSNEGYVVAGAMLEAVAGVPYEELMGARLFAPLGMESAGFGAPTGDGDPRGHREGAQQLVAMPPGPFADNPTALAPAGTAHMRLADWARFVGLHLRRGAREGDPLSAAAFDALHRPRGDDYALGWVMVERAWSSGPVLHHGGSNTMWFCVVWASPDDGFAALVCANAADTGAREACDRVAALLIERRTAIELEPTER